MHPETVHITPYRSHAWVLITLLTFTVITVTVTWIDLSALTVFIALLIASVKSFIVLTYFMHLKYESTLFRVFVFIVLFIYVLVILFTLADYAYR
ncbi:MAG: cytochrome C oxidase subunit IV family protein [Bacteroidales bacterium]|nr:cytochrome C oxidase subunit IV family protein [Bacteroidales bacterium]